MTSCQQYGGAGKITLFSASVRSVSPRVVLASTTLWLLAILGSAAPAEGQDYYAVTFQQVNLTAQGINAGPNCTTASSNTTSAPVFASLSSYPMLVTGRAVRNSNGWLPFTVSIPHYSGATASTLSPRGILTTVDAYSLKPDPSLKLDSDSVTTVETIDLNTGMYTLSTTLSGIKETDPCTGSLYVDEIDPSTGTSYSGPQMINFSAFFSGIVPLTLAQVSPPNLSLAIYNPFSCSILPSDCVVLAGTNTVISGGPALGISADGRSAALIVITSSDAIDPVQITLAASGFSGAIGSLAPYDPNFLNLPSAPAARNTSIIVQPSSSCAGQNNCVFLALLWAPDGFSGNIVSQAVRLTVTATQGASNTSQAQTTMMLLPPPLVLVHGIWADADNTWNPPPPQASFEQYLHLNYPYIEIFRADYGNPLDNYNFLSFSDPHIQAIMEKAVADAFGSAASQGVVARQVDVVAHSMGGLVTRYFMDNINNLPYPLPYLLPNPIHQLITIGTPHLGSPLASTLLAHGSDAPESNGAGKLLSAYCVTNGISPCTLDKVFAKQGRIIASGVKSLVPNTAPLTTLTDTYDYKSIEGVAPPGSVTELYLDLLTVGFTGQTIAAIFQGDVYDTIVGGQSELGPAPDDLAVAFNVVHVALAPGDVGETSDRNVWTQVVDWLMGGSGSLSSQSPRSTAMPPLTKPDLHALNQIGSGSPPVLNLADYLQVPESNVGFSPAAHSILPVNAPTNISATSSTKILTEILLLQDVSDPTDLPVLYATQSPFNITFIPKRTGSTNFVAFALFSDNTFAVTTLNYSFQLPRNPLALNLINVPKTSLPVGASSVVAVQALFSNGHVDVTPVATYKVRSGTARVISANSTGVVTANGPGVDWLDVSYDGLTSSTPISVGNCTYSLMPANQLVVYTGGAVSLEVTTQSGCGWTANTGGAPWLTVRNAGGIGSGTISFTAAANSAGVSRAAIITLPGVDAVVTQPSTACTYGVSQAEIDLPAGGGSGAINVTTSCAVIAWTDQSWITVTPLSSSVAYSVAANTGGSQRTATLTIGTQPLTIVQAGSLIATPSTTFVTLVNFDDTRGVSPEAGLILARDGNFYGTTAAGDSTVFRLSSAGSLAILHVFSGLEEGQDPSALVQGVDGNFYGTTLVGGVNNSQGTVFKMTPGGLLTTLHSFGSKGVCFGQPNGLVLGKDGNFYGTTQCDGDQGFGSVFKITPSGTLTTLHSFNAKDGRFPIGALIQAADGNFYGNTGAGGASGDSGTIFKITPGGTLTTLYNFCSQIGCADGSYPQAALVQGTDGSFYGTTAGGGTPGNCPLAGCGTVFKISPSGTLTTLHRFDGSDGSGPYAGLIQGVDGGFYGTTMDCGSVGKCTQGLGTVYRITAGGIVTTLHTFNGSDGSHPIGGLVQGADGSFYGTTFTGGIQNGGGTAFRLWTTQVPLRGVQNAASYAPGAVSPGEIVVLYGSGMGPATLATLQIDNTSGLVKTTVAGTTVLFGGVPAPIVYASATQVSVIVPYEIAGTPTAPVLVNYQGSTVAAGMVAVASSAPGIFAVNSGTGQASALNQDGSFNSPSNPATAGSTISFYLTGEGQTHPSGVDGKFASVAPYPAPLLPITVTIGGQPATVAYAGAAPDEVAGVMQINAVIPQRVTGRAVPVSVQIGTGSAQSGITIAVQ